MADYILTIDNQSSVELNWYANGITGGNPHTVHLPAGNIAPGKSDYLAWDTRDGKIPKTQRTFGEMWFYVDKNKWPAAVGAVGMYGYDKSGARPCTAYVLGAGASSSLAVGQNTIKDEKEIEANWDPANYDPWIESGVTWEQTYEYVLPMPAGKVKVIVAKDPREGPMYSVLVTFKDYSN
ncbi:hypothetical protein C8R44DRAFT_894005 [Mycena epipterygia]|nr:hypothetical protein C8R44DRAFT_894005 [Mycena epipterygia]